MKILACHNYYRSTSGEDLVFRQDLEILRQNAVDVREFKRENSSVDALGAVRKAMLVPNAVYSRGSAREIRETITSDKPDVAIVQNVLPLISPSAYHILSKFRIPIVQLVYNYRLICPNAILYTEGAICERCVKGNYVHAVVHKCYRGSRWASALYATSLGLHRHLGKAREVITAYVTPDRFLKGKLIEGGYPGERIFPLLNPFDVSKYSPRFDSKGYLVYFGRIVREKGIFTLLSAVRGLPDVRLIVVGGGEAEAEARRRTAEYGLPNVEFVGPRYGDELISILRDAMAVVVPTEWYDNSPLVVHQAFSLGKPVIASRIDGIPEIISDGVDGLLFEPGDVDDLAAKISVLCGNNALRDKLARAARKKAETEFTSQRRFEGLMSVLQFAIGHPIT